MQESLMLPLDEVGHHDRRPAAVIAAETEIDLAFRLYNEMAERCGLAQAELLTDKRRSAMKKRLADGGLTRWRFCLETVERSAFLRGISGGHGTWKAHLDFILQPSSWQKLVERTYDQKLAPEAQQSRAASSPTGYALDAYRAATVDEQRIHAALFNGMTCSLITDRQAAWHKHQAALRAAGQRQRWTMRAPPGWRPLLALPAPPPAPLMLPPPAAAVPAPDEGLDLI
jgi:hypothetical protein